MTPDAVAAAVHGLMMDTDRYLGKKGGYADGYLDGLLDVLEALGLVEFPVNYVAMRKFNLTLEEKHALKGET